MSFYPSLSLPSIPRAWDSPEPTDTTPSADESPPTTLPGAPSIPRPLYLTQDPAKLDFALSAMRSSIRLPYTARRTIRTAQDSLQGLWAQANVTREAEGNTIGVDNEGLSLLNKRVDTKLQSILDTAPEVKKRTVFGKEEDFDRWAAAVNSITRLKGLDDEEGAVEQFNKYHDDLLDRAGQTGTFVELAPRRTSPTNAAYWAYDTATPWLSACKSGAEWPGNAAWSMGTNAYSAICATVRNGTSCISNAVSDAYKWMWPEQKETSSPTMRSMADAYFSQIARENPTKGVKWVGMGEAKQGLLSQAKQAEAGREACQVVILCRHGGAAGRLPPVVRLRSLKVSQ